MRAERLLSIAQDITDDLHDTDIIEKLSELVDALASVESNSSTANQDEVLDAIGEFEKAAKSSRIALYPPALWDEIEMMKIQHLFGDNFISLIREDLQNQAITPSVVRAKLQKRLDQLQLLKERSEGAISSLMYFEIQPDTLGPGEFEVMVMIPTRSIDNELSQLGREAIKINNILGVFSEIATGSREPVKLRAIGSSDPTFYLDSLPATAALVATAIEKVAALYGRTQGVIKTYREMESQGVPEPLLNQMQNFIDESINSGLIKIAAEIEGDHMLHIEPGRKAELNNELNSSLNGIARRLDEGYVFDVHGQPTVEEANEAHDPTDQTHVQASLKIVNSARPRIHHFEPSADRIFLLPKDE